jgi:hypothetical protein
LLLLLLVIPPIPNPTDYPNPPEYFSDAGPTTTAAELAPIIVSADDPLASFYFKNPNSLLLLLLFPPFPPPLPLCSTLYFMSSA